MEGVKFQAIAVSVPQILSADRTPVVLTRLVKLVTCDRVIFLKVKFQVLKINDDVFWCSRELEMNEPVSLCFAIRYIN